MVEGKKINLSNKIYPYFSGFSGDLLFWIAINTIFLTTVKGFSAAQISSLTMIGNLTSIILYPFIFKIIKKINNINSIKLGTYLLLAAALLLTFGQSYSIILIGYVFYDVAFLFKDMENVILRKNLAYENRVDDYLNYQNKASFIYSLITMIISLVSGFIFNINNYLPMILCIAFCVVNIVLSRYLYEYQGKLSPKKKTKKIKFKFTQIIIALLLLYAFLYAVIDLGQDNSKLFIQYKLANYFDISVVSIFLGFITAISRIVRVVSNFLFAHFNTGENKLLLYNIWASLSFAFILIIVGSLIKINVLCIILMSLGSFVFLAVRDIFANYMKTIVLEQTSQDNHEKVITYLTLFRKIGKFLISGIVTLLLIKIDMFYVMLILLVITLSNLILIEKINNLIC